MTCMQEYRRTMKSLLTNEMVIRITIHQIGGYVASFFLRNEFLEISKLSF